MSSFAPYLHLALEAMPPAALLTFIQRLENFPVKLEPFCIQLRVVFDSAMGHVGDYLVLVLNLQSSQQLMQIPVHGQQAVVLAATDANMHLVADLVRVFLD